MLALKKKATRAEQKPARRKKKFKREVFFEFLCVVPELVILAVVAYYPLADLFRISFTDWNLMRRDYTYVGFENWKWFFTNLETNNIIHAFWVTIQYTVGHMIVVLGLGFLFALLFNRISRGFSLMRSIVFMPKYLAMSSAAVVFLWIFNERYGIANRAVQALGGSAIPWLSSSSIAMFTVILVTSWHGVGYDMMVFLSSMQGISKEYSEAAMLDGASKLSILRYITLPMLAPTTMFLAVTQFIGSMKVFQSIDVLTGGGPYRATSVVVMKIYSLAFEDYRVNRSACLSIVFFLVLLIVTRLTIKWSDRKVNYDA